MIDVDVDMSGNVYKDGKMIKPFKGRNGYLTTKINGRNCKVHRLVALKYIKNPEEKPTVNHKDGNKLNNSVFNLEWMTFSENAKHSWANGLADPCKGEKHGRAILDDMKVLTLRTFKTSPNGRTKYNNKHMAELYGVSRTRVNNIKKGKEWSHLPTL